MNESSNSRNILTVYRLLLLFLRVKWNHWTITHNIYLRSLSPVLIVIYTFKHTFDIMCIVLYKNLIDLHAKITWKKSNDGFKLHIFIIYSCASVQRQTIYKLNSLCTFLVPVQPIYITIHRIIFIIFMYFDIMYVTYL